MHLFPFTTVVFSGNTIHTTGIDRPFKASTTTATSVFLPQAFMQEILLQKTLSEDTSRNSYKMVQPAFRPA